jgi:two-component system, NarL family, nitrate/nitrite response regulator NarL
MTTLKSESEFESSKRVGLADLTPRELEILQRVIAGKTNKGIGGELCISEKTVEFHLDKIYRKIGVQTRLMAGIWAIQHD